MADPIRDGLTRLVQTSPAGTITNAVAQVGDVARKAIDRRIPPDALNPPRRKVARDITLPNRSGRKDPRLTGAR